MTVKTRTRGNMEEAQRYLEVIFAKAKNDESRIIRYLNNTTMIQNERIKISELEEEIEKLKVKLDDKQRLEEKFTEKAKEYTTLKQKEKEITEEIINLKNLNKQQLSVPETKDKAAQIKAKTQQKFIQTSLTSTEIDKQQQQITESIKETMAKMEQ